MADDTPEQPPAPDAPSRPAPPEPVTSITIDFDPVSLNTVQMALGALIMNAQSLDQYIKQKVNEAIKAAQPKPPEAPPTP